MVSLADSSGLGSLIKPEILSNQTGSSVSIYSSYTPTTVIAKAMFNFDEFGIANFKVDGIVRVSVSDDFSFADYLNSSFYPGLYTSGSDEVVWTPEMAANI